MEDKTQHRLAAEMDIALMKAHLRLDLTQMGNKDIKESFQRVRHYSIQLISGSKHPCCQTYRSPHSTTIVLSATHFDSRRSRYVGCNDPTAWMDHDLDVRRQPHYAESHWETVLSHEYGGSQ
jgi:hypothetical protein